MEDQGHALEGESSPGHVPETGEDLGRDPEKGVGLNLAQEKENGQVLKTNTYLILIPETGGEGGSGLVPKINGDLVPVTDQGPIPEIVHEIGTTGVVPQSAGDKPF